MFRIWIIIFLVNLEVTIVSTALVAISNQLHSFDKSSWIVSGYQISYTGEMKLCIMIISEYLSLIVLYRVPGDMG